MPGPWIPDFQDAFREVESWYVLIPRWPPGGILACVVREVRGWGWAAKVLCRLPRLPGGLSGHPVPTRLKIEAHVLAGFRSDAR